MLLISMMVLTGFAIAEPEQPIAGSTSQVYLQSTSSINGAVTAGPPDIKKVSAYANYQFSYTPGVSCKYCEWQKGAELDGVSSVYWVNMLFFKINPTRYNVYAYCPLQSIISRNGIHPKIGSYHFAVEATDNTVDLDYIDVYNGRTRIGSYDASMLNIAGYNEYYLNTGYNDMTRGVTLLFDVDNPATTWKNFYIHGYGHKEEW